MSVIKPFKALRPQSELVAKIASLPYDVVDTEEARKLAKDNPLSFLQVDKAEIDLDPSVDHYNQKVYEKARENLNQLIAKKVYLQEKKESMYIYRQVKEGREQTGLVVCASIEDYLQGVIKRHESTRPDKEEDRIKHIDFTNAHTSPVFLTYKARDEIKQLLKGWAEEKKPIYDFTSEDKISHTCWIIDAPQVISRLISAFAEVDCLYIADGHHRAAAAVKVGLKRREQVKNYTGKEEFNYFLSVIFPHDELYIMPYNRVVADLAGNSEERFLQKVSEKFNLEKCVGREPYRPEERHVFGMYLNQRWYKLTAKRGTFKEEEIIDRLDVAILQNNLFGPILGIKDPRTDQRIEFVGGIRGLKELEEKVDRGGMKVAFSLFPTSIEELMAVAEAGRLMPPKSTWFEPKLRSGIFVHKLE